MIADHLLHYRPNPWGGTWRLECLPGSEHFTVHDHPDGEWFGSAADLEAQGVNVDRTTCWVHDHLANCAVDEWMTGSDFPGDDWPEDGPWPVVCSYSGSLDVERVITSTTPTKDES